MKTRISDLSRSLISFIEGRRKATLNPVDSLTNGQLVLPAGKFIEQTLRKRPTVQDTGFC